MVIFHCYVSSPEGNSHEPSIWCLWEKLANRNGMLANKYIRNIVDMSHKEWVDWAHRPVNLAKTEFQDSFCVP